MKKTNKLSPKQINERATSNPSYRKELFEKLKDHLKQGYSLDCFSELDFHTISRFLKDYPEEFVQLELDQALRDGKQGWEAIGRRQADGSCLGNSRSWQFNMANRYGWREKQDTINEHKGDVKVNIVSYSKASSTSEEPKRP